MKMKRAAAWLMTVFLFVSAFPNVSAAAEQESTEAADSNNTSYTYDSIISGKYDTNHYSSYFHQYSTISAPTTRQSLVLSARDVSQEGSTEIDRVNVDWTDLPVTAFSENSCADYHFHVTETALYTVTLQYAYQSDSMVSDSSFSLYLDGSLPFSEMDNMSLARVWGQEALNHSEGQSDIVPKSYQTTEDFTYTVQDESGLFGQYYFYLSAGDHTLQLASEQGGFIADIQLESSVDVYSASTDGMSFNGQNYTVQGEDASLKNDSSLTPGVDRSDASIEPNDPVYKRVNILDGSKFDKVGQRTTWNIQVGEDGLYRLGIRYKQDTLQGVFTSRNLYLDGVALSDCSIEFPYSEDWQYRVVQKDGEDLVLSLKAGVHTLSMEVTLGAMQEYVQQMDELNYVLNFLYRRMIMVCGVSPDSYRDYNLSSDIPYLLSVFDECAQKMDNISAELAKMNVTSGEISILKQFSQQLRSFIDHPYDIQNHLSNYSANISTLSSLVMSLQIQPLAIDYLSLIGSAKGDTDQDASFLQSLGFQFRAFIGSFYCDYAVLDSNDSDSAETIKVWFSGGREQAELLKTIIDEDFTGKTGISVQLQLVGVSLSQSILAGTSPDVNLYTSRYQAVNLGVRGVLEDLSRYEGFDQYPEQWGKEFFVPYSYQSATYALPVALDYLVTFYRTDIFKELGLTVPTTWDEFDRVVKILQRNNLTAGLPYTMLSSAATIESGLGTKDIFATLVLQRGASLYSEDNSKILLNQTEIVDVFKQWTEFYNSQQLSLEYSFYNRFRTGEMPLAIQPYSSYNLLSSAAPEIKGLWSMAQIPGTVQEDGEIDRTTAASGSGIVLLSNSAHKEAAWDFIQWWVSAQAQARFGNDSEQLFGSASRYNPVNPQAMAMLPWTKSELSLLLKVRDSVQELPEVLGGYYVSRGIDNAFRDVVYSSANYKEALLQQNTRINAELDRKQQELNRLN